jgi:hypothetical protein
MAGGQRLISWFHPFSISNVALNTRTCAHGPLMGHPNWAGCDIHPPPPQRTRRPRRSNSPVQCRPIRHAMCPIPGPHAHAYVRTLTRANVQEPSLLAHDRTSSADPYAMPFVPSQAHTRHAPYVCTLTRGATLVGGVLQPTTLSAAAQRPSIRQSPCRRGARPKHRYNWPLLHPGTD